MIEMEKPRWQYRFDNFKRAYFLLQEAVEKYHEGPLDQLAKEGLVKRFGFCLELAWKTTKDYMEYKNFVFRQITPRSVLKEAVAAKVVDDGEAWMCALDSRNEMSHTYDFKKFETVIKQISARYLECFGQLYETLIVEYNETENT